MSIESSFSELRSEDFLFLDTGDAPRASDPDGDGDGGGDGGSGGSGGSDDDWDPDSPLPIPWPPEDLTSEALPDYVRSEIDQILIETNSNSRANDPDGDGDDDSGGSGGSDDDWDIDSPWPMPNPPEAKTSEGTPDFARTNPEKYIFDTATPAEPDHGLDGCWDDRPIRDDDNSGEPEPEPVDPHQSSVLEYAEYDMIIL